MAVIYQSCDDCKVRPFNLGVLGWQWANNA